MRRSDACVLKIFSLCLNVPSFYWLKHGKLSIFECLDNSELFIETVCMYNVSFFFPLSMYHFWSCWGRLYGLHEPLLCHSFLLTLIFLYRILTALAVFDLVLYNL